MLLVNISFSHYLLAKRILIRNNPIYAKIFFVLEEIKHIHTILLSTKLMRTSLPPREINFPCQLLNLFCSLSMTCFHSNVSESLIMYRYTQIANRELAITTTKKFSILVNRIFCIAKAKQLTLVDIYFES
jgi:hypothetical protein